MNEKIEFLGRCPECGLRTAKKKEKKNEIIIYCASASGCKWKRIDSKKCS